MHTFIKCRRSYVTLIETLIAVSLLSILLVIIFGFFRELSILSVATDQQQKESFQLRYLDTRLQHVFERIVNERETSRTFFFYTQPENSAFSSSPSLIFTFDNGIHADPLFSGDVLGRLYLDRSSISTHGDTARLILATWPLFVKDPHHYMHQEILLDHVISMTFHFYSAPEHLSNDKAIIVKEIKVPTKGLDVQNPQSLDVQEEAKEPPADQWFENEWSIDYKQMPVLMKIELTMQKPIDRTQKKQKTLANEQVTLYFVLPTSTHPIHYPKDVIP